MTEQEEQTVEEKLIEQIAKELFGIWQEAKSTEPDSWDDQTFQDLPDKHKHEYYLTAQRIIAKSRAGYKSLGEFWDTTNEPDRIAWAKANGYVKLWNGKNCPYKNTELCRKIQE